MSEDKNLKPDEAEVVESQQVEKAEEPQKEEPKAEVETAEEVKVEVSEEVKPEDIYVKPAHDDFNWDLNKDAVSVYTKDEASQYEKRYEATITTVKAGQVINAKVSSISPREVIINLGYKSEGLVNVAEFKDTPDLKVGDTVDVYVEELEDDKGSLILSRRKAKILKAWERIVSSHENGDILEGLVVSKTKGGLIVDILGLETFLPGSQIDIRPIIDYDQYVGKTMEFKVVKINEIIKNAVVSHKALIESDLAEQRESIIGSLEKGQVLEGIVKNITDFGAFLDLGGVDGLLYITDISWGRISHPSEVLELNQKINVVVLEFDENKKRISLGLKQMQPHPWDTLDIELQEGTIVKGKIVNIEDYGAFLEVKPGVEGLIHVSEVLWSNQPVNAREYFKLGEEHEAKVVTVNREDRKMSLSIKQLSKDPWDEVLNKYPKGSKHTGEVKNLTPYGVFIELEEGIGGMIHISDLSWVKRFGHPSEFTKVGADLDLVILDVDMETRKLSMGHKQLEENPWDTFENVFPEGSYHECTVLKVTDKGSKIQLPYGLEAFCPKRHMKKDDGTFIKSDEILTFKVIEFSRDDKRIIVSHSRYLMDISKEADDQVAEEKQKQRKQTRKAIQDTQSKVEKTTLGDMDVFSQLKDQLKDKE